ncbi:MAG: hypothetical protein AMQ74_00552 [Candidatus Methanofastidiosum methylothiophilum]|uniref:ArnR1-like winged helix-turn-helix domain-containing protein n=1 Tax=Candidatus Methanofastidiosum methylothiophilum TaxID=1705564 RepID=A0A150J701_9EURY|nr:MAG: hypothetical protein AMQ74_00552 [Candidatus Methanofastidiosum methylthiophilus]
MNTEYRTSNVIILNILECVLKKSSCTNDVLKSHILQYANMKTTMAEKYLKILEDAGYLTKEEKDWGKRKVICYRATEKGIERYKWFCKINEELGGV